MNFSVGPRLCQQDRSQFILIFPQNWHGSGMKTVMPIVSTRSKNSSPRQQKNQSGIPVLVPVLITGKYRQFLTTRYTDTGKPH